MCLSFAETFTIAVFIIQEGRRTYLNIDFNFCVRKCIGKSFFICRLSYAFFYTQFSTFFIIAYGNVFKMLIQTIDDCIFVIAISVNENFFPIRIHQFHRVVRTVNIRT